MTVTVPVYNFADSSNCFCENDKVAAMVLVLVGKLVVTLPVVNIGKIVTMIVAAEAVVNHHCNHYFTITVIPCLGNRFCNIRL